MNTIEAAILGFLQGASEFLPISSSGHLAMGQEVLGIALDGIAFEILLHVATLISVLAVYRGRLWRLTRGTLVERDPGSWRYVWLLVLATLPAAIIGIPLMEPVERLSEMPVAVGVALLVTGTILFSTRWALRRNLSEEFGARTALLIGLAQCVALVPGISRSGTTVAAALWLGVAPLEALAFSFLMSIPTILGAAVLKFPDLLDGIGGVTPAALAVGFVVAAGTGILAIRLFASMAQNRSFASFAWYCWGVGGGFLIWLSLT